MDSLHGQPADSAEAGNAGGIAPRPAVHSERRMQVRAYAYWASLLNDNQIPAIDALDRTDPGNFGPNSILLDLTAGNGSATVVQLGDALAKECGVAAGQPLDWSTLPGQTLLSRLTGHYRPLLEDRTPIAFEDGFVNQRGATILYRGIVLPFSADGQSVDFILGVINWKEVTHDAETASLRAPHTAADMAEERRPPAHTLMTDWADGPATDSVTETGTNAGTADETAQSANADPTISVLHGLETISQEGPEFALIMVRRQSDGTLRVLGEVPHDPAMLDEAARTIGQ